MEFQPVKQCEPVFRRISSCGSTKFQLCTFTIYLVPIDMCGVDMETPVAYSVIVIMYNHNMCLFYSCILTKPIWISYLSIVNKFTNLFSLNALLDWFWDLYFSSLEGGADGLSWKKSFNQMCMVDDYLTRVKIGKFRFMYAILKP